ncbi:MAG: MMPL family transporter [Acidobacteria bacterium]|nr:MMPL family transporter [Acidobacteriota bacterium]
MAPRRFFLAPGQWAALAVCLLMGVWMFAVVDLTPEVEANFFFDSDDPQLRETRRIAEIFGQGQPVFVAVRPERLASRKALFTLRNLSEALGAIEGVASVRSLTHGPEDPKEIVEEDPEEVLEDIRKSPFWTSLLLAPDSKTTFVVVRLSGKDQEQTVQAIDRVMARFQTPDFELAVSGVPYAVEHIRRNLSRDLQTFSVAALAMFTLLVALLFRSLPVVVGTIISALTAAFATFIVRHFLGMETGILTPNLWTIAFVLTLSHVVYLTANYRLAAREKGKESALRESVLLTGPPSLWSLAANLLGFLSLVFVSAKPLKEFGISGGIAAFAAAACAYGMYPAFLVSFDPPAGSGALRRALQRFFSRPHPLIAAGLTLGALALAPFSFKVDTDPTLLSYFAEGDRIREGIERIDQSAGSSPLDLVVRDARGETLASGKVYERLRALHSELERDPSVGSVLSVANLLAEIDRHWFSFLLPWEYRLGKLEDPKHDRIGRTFFSQDRTLGRFILRMQEQSRQSERTAIVSRLQATVRRHGFEPVLTGGLFVLQGEISRLVHTSVLRGLGGLIVAFLLIGLVTSRSLRASLAMAFCLALIPFALFGFIGLVDMPLDIIAAPAANVALPMGIDEMIHLGYALRRERRKRSLSWPIWSQALGRMWYPICASVVIVASGFTLLLLSRFPPTQRLGTLVCAGTALTDAVVLIVLPWLATLGQRRSEAPREPTAGSDGYSFTNGSKEKT